MSGQFPGFLAQFILITSPDDQYLDLGKAFHQCG